MGELRTRQRGKNKRWEWSFEGAKINGKRKPISKGGYKTKAEALRAGREAQAEYENAGRAFIPSEISLADFLDYWLEQYVKKDLKHNTFLDYESKIRNHIKPSLGQYKLSSIEPDIIQKWLYSKKDQGLSKSMVKNMLACLSGAFNYAVLPCKYIKSNPCNYVRLPRMSVDRSTQEYIDYICKKEDFNKICERFPSGSNFYTALMLGYHLGTRIGETYGINLLQDVDFDKHEIKVSHQLQSEGKLWYYREPKYNSYRTLKMGKTLEAILKDTIKQRKKDMLRHGEYFMKTYIMPDSSLFQARANISIPYPEIMPLCAKENGELLTPRSFKYCSRVIHHELGLTNFHYHSLRHTHGTILSENGASPKSVMERLGHKDIKVTLNTYVFNTEKMQQDTVDIFEEAIQ